MTEDYRIDTFQTDTYQVWFGGARLLPDMAHKYSQMTQVIYASRGSVDEAFATGHSLTGQLPEMYAQWDRLRTTFQDILATTSNNLAGTGVALTRLAEELAATDTQGADDIAKAKEGLIDDIIPVQPPKTSADGQPTETGDNERYHGHTAE